MHLGFCMRVNELIQNRLIMIINPIACCCYISKLRQPNSSVAEFVYAVNNTLSASPVVMMLLIKTLIIEEGTRNFLIVVIHGMHKK